MAVIHLGTMKDCENECLFGGVRYGDFTTTSSRVDDWLRHFEVYSQGNGSDTPRRLYAWQTCYDSPCKPDCEDMRVGAAIIGEVEKRMQREEKTYGICQSYGQYVARVARALGCAHILIPPPKGQGQRVVCANTYAIALAEGYVKELAVPHKGDVKAKLAQARRILGLANEKFDQYAQQTRALAAHRLTGEEWDKYLDIMCPVPDRHDPDWSEEREERIRKTREDVAVAYLLGEAQRLPGIERTAWAAFNAVTEHIDHLPRRGATQERKAEARFNVCLYGPGRDMKERAFQTACKFAESELALEAAIENTVLAS
jgi:hypothetical protein